MFVPFAQLVPLIMGVGKAIKFVLGLKYAAALGRVATMARSAAVSIMLMGNTTAVTNGISLGFLGNLGRITIMMLRFATVGVWSGIKPSARSCSHSSPLEAHPPPLRASHPHRLARSNFRQYLLAEL